MNAQALVDEGNGLYRAGDREAALSRYAAAATAEPGYARAHFNLGVVTQELGRRDEAIGHYRRAIEADPRFAAALVNLGNVLREAGRAGEAAELYARALEVAPSDRHALNNLAGIALEDSDFERARALYARLIEAGGLPGAANAGVHHGYGVALARLGRDAEALAHFEHAAQGEAGRAAVLLDWAESLARVGRTREAEAKFERALEIEPGNARALGRFAAFNVRHGDMRRAQHFFARSAQSNPQDPSPRFHAGVMALINQDFAAGWEGHELRFEFPPWRGSLEPLDLPYATPANIGSVRRLAVRKEQGVGDQLLFSTLLPDLAGLGLEIVAEVDARLLQAYRRALPAIAFVAPDEAMAAFAGCDHQAPIGSLARILRPSRESFAAQPRALLRADPRRLRELEPRMGRRPRVGITWRSFRGKEVGESKSFALERFGVFEGSGASLVDLQYGAVGAERESFDARHPGLRHGIEDLDLYFDFEGLLAAIDLCDLVVTGSNVTAHLAGAVGKRTWLVYLEGIPPFHYWAPGPDGRSLWYPGVEIMTDRGWTGWEQALEAVAARWRAQFGG